MELPPTTHPTSSIHTDGCEDGVKDGVKDGVEDGVEEGSAVGNGLGNRDGTDDGDFFEASFNFRTNPGESGSKIEV